MNTSVIVIPTADLFSYIRSSWGTTYATQVYQQNVFSDTCEVALVNYRKPPGRQRALLKTDCRT